MAHSHHHRSNKLVTITSLLIMIATTLVLFNATLDENAGKKFSTDNMLLKFFVGIFALLGGVNAFFETKDHLGHVHEKLIPEKKPLISSTTLTAQPNLSNEIYNTRSYSHGKFIIKITSTLAMLPLVTAASFGLYMQSVALMKSFHMEDELTQYLSAAPLAAVLNAKFFIIPFRHTLRNIFGGHAEFTAEVTGSIAPITFLRIPTARGGAFLVLVASHLVESFLMSNETGELLSGNWSIAAFWLSVTGLAVGSGFSHLDHFSAVFDTYTSWRSQSLRVRIITAFIGILSGIAHGAAGILGTFFYWNKTGWFGKGLMCLSDGIDFLLGWLESQQHMGRRFLEGPQVDLEAGAAEEPSPSRGCCLLL